MKTLRVVDLAKNHLGTIQQSPDGTLHLEVVDERFRKDLEGLVQRVTTGPVWLTSGDRTEAEGRITYTTQRKVVHPGDADFLAGVQELLKKARFGETRVRGLLLKGGSHV